MFPCRHTFLALAVLTFVAVPRVRGGAPPSETPAKSITIPRTHVADDPLPDGAMLRLGTLRFRHERLLSAVVWSPDGKMLATSSYYYWSPNTIRLWDAATGKEVRRMDHAASTLAWSPDGTTLASGEVNTGPIRLWNVATGKEIGQLTEVQGVASLAWSGDGKILAASGSGSSVWFFDATGKKIHELTGHNGFVAWSPDGKTLASASYDKTIRLWDVATGKEVCRLTGHENAVHLVALASVSADKTIRFWDPAAAKEIRRIAGAPDKFTRLFWSPDGKTLASVSADKTIRFWDPAAAKEIRRIAGAADGFTRLFWSPDGKTLASGGYTENATRLWEAATGKELRRLAGLQPGPWSPDGKAIVLRDACSLLLWDPATGKEILGFKGHAAAVNAVAWSPDGKILASASDDRTVRLWNTRGKEMRVLEGHRSFVKALSWSPDAKTLATGDWEFTIRLWDAVTGRPLRHLTTDNAYVEQLAWSPDGRTLASADKYMIYLWEPATGKQIHQIASETPRIRSLVWAPDGKTFASAGWDGDWDDFQPNAVRLYNAATGNELLRLPHASAVWSAAWSPDGKALALATQNTIRLLETATVKEVCRFTAPGASDKEWYAVLAWSPDGRTLASRSGTSSAIVLWDVATGQEIRRLRGHADTIRSLAWSPDGRRLASGSYDTTILIWAIPERPRELSLDLSLPELTSCWTDLAGEDAAKAYQTIRTLTRSAGHSVPFLAERLRPAPAPDPQRLSRLIQDLDSKQFAVRKKAGDELEGFGDSAEPALRRALSNTSSLETRRRLERLLKKADGLSAERLRVLRATTVLENIASAEARRILESLATGAPHARLTVEAKASLDRLGKR